ncbi:MAG TPA: hypothetical protein VGC39_07655 [Candidatus Methylacidiphilales bacterium]
MNSCSFWWMSGACAALLLGSAPAVVGAPSMAVILLDAGGPKKETVAPVPSVFGNREQPVGLTLATSFEGPAYLRADLFQIAGTLSMPLANDMHLQDVTFSHVPAQNVAFSIKLPDVKRATEILAKISLVPKDTQVAPLPIADIRYRVFPASVTQELIDLLQPKSGDSAPVVLFGPGQSLRHFLTGLHAPFEDAGSGTPDRLDADRLYFGELATDDEFKEAQDRSAGARMVLFSSDESMPAGVYAERSDSGVLIHVTSPLLDNLSADPQAQLGLIKIIHLLSASISSAK